MTRLLAGLALLATGGVIAYLVIHANRSPAAHKTTVRVVHGRSRIETRTVKGRTQTVTQTATAPGVTVTQRAATPSRASLHQHQAARRVMLAGRPVPVPRGWRAVEQHYPGREHVSLVAPHGDQVLIDRTAHAVPPRKLNHGYHTMRTVSFHDGRLHGTLWQFRAKFCHGSCTDYLVSTRHSALAAMTTSHAQAVRSAATRALMSLTRSRQH